MSVSKLSRVDELAREVAGCPLAEPAADGSARACLGCSYNLVGPQMERVGCVVHTPEPVVAAALAALGRRAPELSARLARLRAEALEVEGGQGSRLAQQWLQLALQWVDKISDAPGTDPEREVAQVIARFANAALRLGEAVQILR